MPVPNFVAINFFAAAFLNVSLNQDIVIWPNVTQELPFAFGDSLYMTLRPRTTESESQTFMQVFDHPERDKREKSAFFGVRVFGDNTTEVHGYMGEDAETELEGYNNGLKSGIGYSYSARPVPLAHIIFCTPEEFRKHNKCPLPQQLGLKKEGSEDVVRVRSQRASGH